MKFKKFLVKLEEINDSVESFLKKHICFCLTVCFSCGCVLSAFLNALFFGELILYVGKSLGWF